MHTDLQIFCCNNTHASAEKLSWCDAIDLHTVLLSPAQKADVLLSWRESCGHFGTACWLAFGRWVVVRMDGIIYATYVAGYR